jgi:hypothetical protein
MYKQTEQQKNEELYFEDTQEKINEIKQVQELLNVIEKEKSKLQK